MAANGRSGCDWRKAACLALARKAVKHDWHIPHGTAKNEVPPCRLKSRKPYSKAQEMLSVLPEDGSKDAWIAATWKQEWEASEPTRVHRHVSDPGKRRQGRRNESKTLDDSKQTANWGRSVQSIYEELSGDWRTVQHLSVASQKAPSLALTRKAVKHDWHIPHGTAKNEVPPWRLKSRKPYSKAQEMLSVLPEDWSKDAWIAATWKQEWEASEPTRVHIGTYRTQEKAPRENN